MAPEKLPLLKGVSSSRSRQQSNCWCDSDNKVCKRHRFQVWVIWPYGPRKSWGFPSSLFPCLCLPMNTHWPRRGWYLCTCREITHQPLLAKRTAKRVTKKKHHITDFTAKQEESLFVTCFVHNTSTLVL